MIGTAAALAIALGSAGATAASNIYGTKKAAETNKRSLEATERDSVRAADLERESTRELLAFQREEAARRDAARQQAMEFDRQRWGDYTRIHEPHWQMGSGVLQSLTGLAGVKGGPAPRPGPSGPPMPGNLRSLADMGTFAPMGGPAPQIAMTRPRMAAPMMEAPQGGGMNLMNLAQMAQMFRKPGGTPAVAS